MAFSRTASSLLDTGDANVDLSFLKGNGWVQGGNTLASNKSIGSTNGFNVDFIQSGNTIFTVNATGVSFTTKRITGLANGTNPSDAVNLSQLTSFTAPAAGSTGNVQYNNGGVFGANSNINLDNANTRLIVGTTLANTDATLQVRGAVSGTKVLLAEDNSGNDIMIVRNTGLLQFGNNVTYPHIYQSRGKENSVNYSGGTITIKGALSPSSVLSHSNLVVTNDTVTMTNGEYKQIYIPATSVLTSTSGGPDFNGLVIEHTLNKTIGVGGVERGIWINPTLSGLIGGNGYRAIEVTYDEGGGVLPAYGFYDSVSLNHHFAGKVGLSDAYLPAYTLDCGTATDAMRIPNGPTASRPSPTSNPALFRYNTSFGLPEFCNGVSWVLLSTGGTGTSTVPLSSITAATTTNSINSANFAQTWTWDSLTTQTALTLSSSSMTSGTLLSLINTNLTLNSTKGLLNIINNNIGSNGLTLRVSSSTSNTDSGIVVNGNGMLGVNTITPTAMVHLGGTPIITNGGVNGMLLRVGPTNLSDGTAIGTIAHTAISSFNATTVISSNLITYSNASTLYIAGAPIAGTNVTITRPFSLFVAGGNNVIGGKTFIGSNSGLPSANLHLAAGSDFLAPLKFQSGTTLTTPENGAVEYDGSQYYATIGTNRSIILRGLKDTFGLTFSAISASSYQDQLITITGAVVGDSVTVGVPSSIVVNTIFFAWVSAADTVTIRCINNGTSATTSLTGTFKITVIK